MVMSVLISIEEDCLVVRLPKGAIVNAIEGFRKMEGKIWIPDCQTVEIKGITIKLKESAAL